MMNKYQINNSKRLGLLMRFFTFIAFFLAALFAFNPVAHALDQYKIDKGHTRVVFFVNHLGFSNMPGVFKKIDGTFSFSEDNVEESIINMTVDAASVDIFHGLLNEKLLEKDYFNVAEHPTITFKSTKIEKTSDKTGLVTGDLTMLGITKSITLDVTFNQGDFNQYAGKYTVGFTGHATLKRSDFGMTVLLPSVGDDIEFRVEMEGHRIDEQDSNIDTR